MFIELQTVYRTDKFQVTLNENQSFEKKSFNDFNLHLTYKYY